MLCWRLLRDRKCLKLDDHQPGGPLFFFILCSQWQADPPRFFRPFFLRFVLSFFGLSLLSVYSLYSYFAATILGIWFPFDRFHAPLKIGSDAHAAIIAANFFQRRHGSTKVCWIRDSARNQRLFPGSELPEKLPFFHLPLGTKPHGFISRRATFCRWSSCCSPPLHKAMLMQKTTR